MAKKKIRHDGIVFSTDPDFRPEMDAAFQAETLAPGQQKLLLRLDTKQRAGKAVTLIQGFSGKEADLEGLSKKLKTFCGTGGSSKGGEIIIQGDQRAKLQQWFLLHGYVHTKRV